MESEKNKEQEVRVPLFVCYGCKSKNFDSPNSKSRERVIERVIEYAAPKEKVITCKYCGVRNLVTIPF